MWKSSVDKWEKSHEKFVAYQCGDGCCGDSDNVRIHS